MTINKLATIGSSIVVLTVLSIGLFILGSPAEERSRRLDRDRVADLLQLSRGIDAHFKSSDSLPLELPAVVDGQRIRQLPRDPETRAMYQYEIIDTDSYRLCAEFSTTSAENNLDDFWFHPAGTHCFDFKAPKNE